MMSSLDAKSEKVIVPTGRRTPVTHVHITCQRDLQSYGSNDSAQRITIFSLTTGSLAWGNPHFSFAIMF